MERQAIHRKPRYFFAVFGDPVGLGKAPVDGGCYPHRKGYSYISNLDMKAADLVLLYCTEDYLKYPKEAPGMGIVTDTETGGSQEKFYYHFCPLDPPVDWDTIIANIPELKGCTNFGFSGNWLREISSASFQRALAGRQIKWP